MSKFSWKHASASGEFPRRSIPRTALHSSTPPGPAITPRTLHDAEHNGQRARPPQAPSRPLRNLRQRTIRPSSLPSWHRVSSLRRRAPKQKPNQPVPAPPA